MTGPRSPHANDLRGVPAHRLEGNLRLHFRVAVAIPRVEDRYHIGVYRCDNCGVLNSGSYCEIPFMVTLVKTERH